jgi:hypothetical protein
MSMPDPQPAPVAPNPSRGTADRITALLASASAITMLVVLGIAARIMNYAANRSLWHDEATLALNLLSRSWIGLARPLDLQQIAPLGFLWTEKLAITLLGSSEWTLRLFPLAAGCVALVLMAVVAHRLLRGIAVPLSVGLFAVSMPVIYFAGEAKQYSFDVAIALAIMLLALRARDEPLTVARGIVLGVLGAIAPWFSQPAVFALGGAGLFVLLGVRGRRAQWRGAAVTFTLWAVSCALAIEHALRGHTAPTRVYLDAFWEPAFLPWWDGFLPALRWLGHAMLNEFTWLFPDPLPWALILLSGIGVGAMARRRSPEGLGLIALLLGPTLLALLASALRLYPFATRLTLFVSPAMALAIGFGIDALSTRTAVGRSSAPATALAVVVFVLAARALRDLPMVREELRPVEEYVGAHRRPGDMIYVYYGALPAFRYYAGRARIGSSEYIAGRCARTAWPLYLADLRPLRGHPRVWLVLAHPFARLGIREDSLFTQYLGSAGTLMDERRAYGALAALYDLSDTTQVDSATHVFRPPRSGNASGAREMCGPEGGA